MFYFYTTNARGGQRNNITYAVTFTYDTQASWRIIVSIKVNPAKRVNYIGVYQMEELQVYLWVWTLKIRVCVYKLFTNCYNGPAVEFKDRGSKPRWPQHLNHFIEALYKIPIYITVSPISKFNTLNLCQHFTLFFTIS